MPAESIISNPCSYCKVTYKDNLRSWSFQTARDVTMADCGHCRVEGRCEREFKAAETVWMVKSIVSALSTNVRGSAYCVMGSTSTVELVADKATLRITRS